MGAIVNGLALSNLRAFGSTFLIFSDYMKPPIRLSALMELPAIYHLHPRLHRPGRGRPDPPAGRATVAAAPCPGLITCARRRQRGGRGLAGDHRSAKAPAGLPGAEPPGPADPRPQRYAPAVRRGRGAYVLADAKAGKPAVILIGTGSEVGCA
jgi:transketolase